MLDVLAEAYYADGQLAEALYHAELAAERAPGDAAILHRLADLYAESGDASQALLRRVSVPTGSRPARPASRNARSASSLRASRRRRG